MAEPVPAGRRERRAEAARLRIIGAAEELLSEQGVQGVTLDAVAERADVVVQTIYNRVGNRSALLLAVAQRAVEENRAYVDPAYALSATPEERIRAALAAYTRFASERPHQFRLMTSPPHDPDMLAQIDDLIAAHMTQLTTALREGIAAGTISADLDPETTAPALWAMCSGILSLAGRATSGSTSRYVLAHLLDVFETVVARGIANSTAPER